MATRSLRALAQHLDVPERTLRRAATEGLVRGERESPRKFRASLREEAYLRANWPLLRELRAVFRTEPNVRFALLFGSLATGRSTERSDVDLLVDLTNPAASRIAELTGRLEDRLGRDVQLVRLEDARRVPALMAAAIEDGRVLVNRDGGWHSLAGSAACWRRRAEKAGVALEDTARPLEIDD